MPGNNTKWTVHYWQGKYGGLGLLQSIDSIRGPFPHLPYALDNGRYPCFVNGTDWDEDKYLKLLTWASASKYKPLFALVPDRVGDVMGTFEEWQKWKDVVKGYGLKIAFAMQGDMKCEEVPKEVKRVFIGGINDNIRKHTIREARKYFEYVHVGRINTYKWLKFCHNAGVDSCDGTGWFRGCKRQLNGLEAFLKEQAGMLPSYQQEEWFL